jgi:hypothetical protein
MMDLLQSFLNVSKGKKFSIREWISSRNFSYLERNRNKKRGGDRDREMRFDHDDEVVDGKGGIMVLYHDVPLLVDGFVCIRPT